MSGFDSLTLEAYAGGYDPERYRAPREENLVGPFCDGCPEQLGRRAFIYEGKNYCLSCALEAAGITEIEVDR